MTGTRYTVAWGHLALLALIAAATAWYLVDARAASLNINNLLLVQPTALFVLGMVLLIVPQCFRSEDEVAGADATEAGENRDANDVAKITVLAVLLGAFVFLLEPLGFDLAMFLFVLAAMAVCGERRPLPLIVYPAAVTLILVSGFRFLMPYPMPTMIL